MSIIYCEFLIPRGPVSSQGSPKGKNELKTVVRAEAQKAWTGSSPIKDANLQLTLIYLCRDNPPDTDNIIKPIQDALNKLVYEDAEVLNVKILRIVSKLCIGIGDTKFDQLMTLFSIDNGFYLGKTQRL